MGILQAEPGSLQSSKKVEFRESLPKSLLGKVLRRELKGTERQGESPDSQAFARGL